MIKLFYSSGQNRPDYQNESSKSLGGLMTNAEVPNNDLRNLFSPISQNMLGRGSVDYRAIFINSTTTISLLKMKMLTPQSTTTLNPNDLVGVEEGDKFIVPVGAQGAWKDKDGQIARFNEFEEWSFSLRDYADFSFGFITPVSATINGTTYTDKFIPFTDSVFKQPNNIKFYKANEILDIKANMSQNTQLGMWIKRIVRPYVLTTDELKSVPQDSFYLEQFLDIIFTYEE